MPPGPSPKDDDERIYACPHCPKRYVRKDYLERHELNHTRPTSVCPACGKGFARPDVLRKHLFTSCKSRRTGDGDPPPPLTTAEEDALVPRKRRRPQRRLTIPGVNDGVPPLRMASHGHPSMTNGHRPVSAHARTHSHPYPAANPALGEGMDSLSRSHGHNYHQQHGGHSHSHSHLHFHHQAPHHHPRADHPGFSASPTPSDVTTESGAPGSSSGLPGQNSVYGAHQSQYGNGGRLDHYRVAQRLSGAPVTSPLDHHDPQSGMHLLSPQQSQPRYAQHLQHHHAPPQSPMHGHSHAHQHPHHSANHRLGPARAGGSLEVLLAPAFATTPETTFGFGFATPKDNGELHNANQASHVAGLPHPLPPPHGLAGVHGGGSSSNSSSVAFEQQRSWTQTTPIDNSGLETSANVAVQQGFGVAGLSPDLPVPTTTGDASLKIYSSTGNPDGGQGRDHRFGAVGDYYASTAQRSTSGNFFGDGVGPPIPFTPEETEDHAVNSFTSSPEHRRLPDFYARDTPCAPVMGVSNSKDDSCSWLFDTGVGVRTARWSPDNISAEQVKTPDEETRVTILEVVEGTTFSVPLNHPLANNTLVTPAQKPRPPAPRLNFTAPPFLPHPEDGSNECGPCPF